MGIWVRNQDGAIVCEVKYLSLSLYEGDEYVYKAEIINEDCAGLAYYDSKEKALKVLDDFVNFINVNGETYKKQPNGEITKFGVEVYQLPKNEDVYV